MVNNIINVNSSMSFSKPGKAYYYFDGLNLFLANFVKRWGVYRSNSSVVSVDVLGKAGIGPVLPHFHSKLPVDAVDGGQLVFGGWNYGLEAAARVTLYRYGYFELGGRYDYAMLDNLQLYQGTARQNLTSYQLVASIGFTLPTTRLNPLFRKEKRIVTLLPWYNHKDELNGENPNKSVTEPVGALDSAGGPGIPEFGDIVNKGDSKYNLDSLAAIDSMAKVDTTRPDTTEGEKRHSRRWFKKHKKDVADTTAAPAADTVVPAPPAADTSIAPPPPPPAPDTVKPAPLPTPEPEPAKTPELKQEEKAILKEAIEGVNFESSKDIIQKSSYKILDQVVKLMKDHPTYKLQINGHTDNKGSATFNKTLSQKRAIAVKKYLTDHGIAGSRLKTAGYGGERPIADNNTDEGKLKNRRVEFIIE
jgi:outer membrane protein OmpA-like peptidoglycan-associated protein